MSLLKIDLISNNIMQLTYKVDCTWWLDTFNYNSDMCLVGQGCFLLFIIIFAKKFEIVIQPHYIKYYDSYHINIKNHLYFYTTQSADTTIDACYRQFNAVLFVFQLYFAVFCRFVAIQAQITQQQKMYMHFLNHTVY